MRRNRIRNVLEFSSAIRQQGAARRRHIRQPSDVWRLKKSSRPIAIEICRRYDIRHSGRAPEMPPREPETVSPR